MNEALKLKRASTRRRMTFAGAIFVFGIATATVLHIFVTDLAHISYRIQRPSTRAECSRITPGMTLDQVQDQMDRKAEPYEQSLDNYRFTFWREDALCAVEFDSRSMVVVNARIEESPFVLFRRAASSK